jgi:hypothetical protein
MNKCLNQDFQDLMMNRIKKKRGGVCVEQKIDDELTYKIIGCAMKVHNTLRNGFQVDCLTEGILRSSAYSEKIGKP